MDITLLDLGLPDRDGLELVSLFKQHSDTTLIVVSARDATDQKVAALDLGADDYLTKPFDTDELLARVRVALRNRLTRDGGMLALAVEDVTQPRIICNELGIGYRLRLGNDALAEDGGSPR